MAIRRVRVNELTGRILVEYAPDELQQPVKVLLHRALAFGSMLPHEYLALRRHDERRKVLTVEPNRFRRVRLPVRQDLVRGYALSLRGHRSRSRIHFRLHVPGWIGYRIQNASRRRARPDRS